MELILSAVVSIVTVYLIIKNLKGCLKFLMILAAIALGVFLYLVYG